MSNVRYTVIPTFNDFKHIRKIVNIDAQHTTLVTREDHEICYIDTPTERYISAERWNLDVYELCHFMSAMRRPRGNQYSFTSPASFAMSLWKMNFAPPDFAMYPDGGQPKFSRPAIFGGRCEVLEYGSDVELHQYDITSSYPAASLDIKAYPSARSFCFYGVGTMRNIMYREGVSEVTFSQDARVPYLPFRHDNRVLYPIADHLTGVYTHLAIRSAIERGVIIHSVGKQYVADTTTLYNPFEEFVAYCFPRRQEHRIWKKIINSLIGRLAVISGKLLRFKAVSPVFDMSKIRSGMKNFFGMACVAQGVTAPPEANVVWSAMILDKAREKLYDAAITPGVKYMDTDCVMSDREIPVLKVGSGIGDWKHKLGVYTLRGAKQYAVTEANGKTRIILKGVPARYRHMGDFFGAAYTAERVVLETGETIPYVLRADPPPVEPRRFRVKYADLEQELRQRELQYCAGDE